MKLGLGRLPAAKLGYLGWASLECAYSNRGFWQRLENLVGA